MSPAQFLAAIDYISAYAEPANDIDASLQELQAPALQNLEPGKPAGLVSYEDLQS